MERDLSLPGSTLLIVCVLFSLAGCAPQSSWIAIGYEPPADVTDAIQSAHGVSLCIEEFIDVRGAPEPNVVGQAKTGMFNRKTPVRIGVEIERLAIHAFREAFSDAGFNLVDDQNNADLVFKGRINTFWVQEYSTAWAPQHSEAEVEFDVVLIDKARAKNIWFDVKKALAVTKPTTMDITLENERIICEAFNQVVSSVVKDSELAQAVNDFANSKE
jgi:uncharacterized lipoprotein YajG